MTTHFYIKTHRVIGLKYFDKTIKDQYTYNGSGSYWIKYLQNYAMMLKQRFISLMIILLGYGNGCKIF